MLKLEKEDAFRSIMGAQAFMHSFSLSMLIPRDAVRRAYFTDSFSKYTAILDTPFPKEFGVEAYWSSWMLSSI